MVFAANDSPLAGRSGRAVTGRAIGERLVAEAEGSVSLRVTPIRVRGAWRLLGSDRVDCASEPSIEASRSGAALWCPT
jgi:predicted membrane GTPase involved in stress response